MPARKIFSNGYVYWIARHPGLGLLVYEKGEQDGAAADHVRVFIEKERCYRDLLQKELREVTSSDVNDQDIVKIAQLYNQHKISLGKPVKAPDYDPIGKLPLLPESYRSRNSVCWKCKRAIDTTSNDLCPKCKWRRCSCGACKQGCDRRVKRA